MNVLRIRETPRSVSWASASLLQVLRSRRGALQRISEWFGAWVRPRLLGKVSPLTEGAMHHAKWKSNEIRNLATHISYFKEVLEQQVRFGPKRWVPLIS